MEEMNIEGMFVLLLLIRLTSQNVQWRAFPSENIWGYQNTASFSYYAYFFSSSKPLHFYFQSHNLFK